MRTIVVYFSAILFFSAITAHAQYQYRSDDNNEVIRSILEDRVRVRKSAPDTVKVQAEKENPNPVITPDNTQVKPDTPVNNTRPPRNNSSSRQTQGKPKAKKKGEVPPASGADKVLLETGITLFDGGNDQAAIEKFRQLREKFPASPYNDQSSIWLAKTLIRTGKPKDALAELERIGEDSGEYPASLYLSGQIYRDLQQYDKAIEQFFRVSSRFPGSDLADDALIASAKIFLSQKQGTLALTTAAQVVKLYPDRDTLDDAYFLIGMVLEKDPTLRDIEKARLIFKKFVQRAEVEKIDVFANSPLLDRVKKEIAFIEKNFMKSR